MQLPSPLYLVSCHHCYPYTQWTPPEKYQYKYEYKPVTMSNVLSKEEFQSFLPLTPEHLGSSFPLWSRLHLSQWNCWSKYHHNYLKDSQNRHSLTTVTFSATHKTPVFSQCLFLLTLHLHTSSTFLHLSIHPFWEKPNSSMTLIY